MQLETSVERVLETAIDLIDITSLETELLRSMRPHDIQALMEQKQKVAGVYHGLLKKLDRRRDVFADLPERLRDEVRQTSDWVKLILAENARLLRASVDANEKLLLAIKKAAEETYGNEIGTYDREAKVGGAPSRTTSVQVTLGLNETT